MASGAAPRPRSLNDYKGRALLWLAGVLEHTIAGKPSHKVHKRRRDRAMRAAHAHGATPEAIAERTGLGLGHVRKILKGEQTDV